METLLDYLTSSNPVLDRTNCTHGTTKAPEFLYDTPKSLELWSDFDSDSLYAIDNGSFKKILESQFDLEDFSNIPEIPFRQIFDEDSLESLLIKWTQSVVTEALAKAQSNTGSKPYTKLVYMVKGGQGLIHPIVTNGQRTTRRLPDWAGVLRSSGSCGRPENKLPGDSKLSSKWDSSKVQEGDTETFENSKNWMGPIKQIYTYCVRANARYGYLITDRELLAVRVRPTHTYPSKQSAAVRARTNGVLEFKIIPWDNDKWTADDASGGLTVNLALWWLHMMVNAGHEVDNSYTPLKEVRRNSSDEDEEIQGIDNSQDWGSQTPSESGTRGSFYKTPNQSFRSGTSDIRRGISKTSLEQKGKRATSTPVHAGKKRTRDESEPRREHSRTRQRGNSNRRGKKV
ncbi:MAG: hypothetical protein Q9188_001900 [Gyalolechia gomerana]